MSQVGMTPVRHTRWWREVALIVVFYSIYTLVRNQFGSATLAPGELPVDAFENARRVIEFERSIGLFFEERMQDLFLHGPRLFIQFWNTFYGTAHFIVTVAAFVLLYIKRPTHFARWRNTLGATTALALIGFALLPVMPPRLVDAPAPTGGVTLAAQADLGDVSFVDTLKDYGGPWSFDSGAMQKLSNQYAAMPSLHIAWSLWCAFVLWGLTTRRSLRVLIVLYPIATMFCIVVTGNHFWIDGLAGALVLGAGYLIGSAIDRWWTAYRHRRGPASAPVSADGGELALDRLPELRV